MVLGGVTQPTEALGFGTGPGERILRFEIEKLPLADGHFHVRCGLVDATGARLLHALEDALRFYVHPSGGESGSVLLEGRWSMQEIATPTQIG
jgi:hypothetical protein